MQLFVLSSLICAKQPNSVLGNKKSNLTQGMAELFVYVPSCLGHLFYFFPSNLFTEFSCHSAAFQGQHLSEWHPLLSNNDCYIYTLITVISLYIVLPINWWALSCL